MKNVVIFSEKPYTGRLGRIQYILGTLASFFWLFTSCVLVVVIKKVFDQEGLFAVCLFSVFFVIFFLNFTLANFTALSLRVRRWHDLSASGWMLFLDLIPIVNLLVLTILCFIPSKEEENEYGKEPKTYKIFCILFNRKSETINPSSEKYLPLVAVIANILVFLWIYFIYLG
ncbi:MAG TPA: DUF805 domain-containing protein [Candidatus Paceibacterota bacterium]|nr:DUF805 domain-containing protein [Candidatus Paceibacterota bacterium]